MEVSGVWRGVGIIILIILVWCASRFLNWVWFKPKRMEKCLRKQGLKGNSYRFLFGDMKEFVKIVKEAKSKPINLNDDIVTRVLPYNHKVITVYGTRSGSLFLTIFHHLFYYNLILLECLKLKSKLWFLSLWFVQIFYFSLKFVFFVHIVSFSLLFPSISLTYFGLR